MSNSWEHIFEAARTQLCFMQQQVRTINKPVLVQLRGDLEPHEGGAFGLLTTVVSSIAPNQSIFAWDDPNDAMRLVAWGEALRISNVNEWDQLTTSMISDNANMLPLAWTAMTFDHQRAIEETTVRPMTIPQAMIVDHKKLQWVINILIDPKWDMTHVEAMIRYALSGNQEKMQANRARECNNILVTTNRAVWCERVVRAQREIQQGNLQKVVLARAVNMQAAAKLDAVRLLHELRVRQPDARCFAVWDRGTIFVGASPELLVRREGTRVETCALAGTRPRGKTDEDDARLAAALYESAKDQREHALVVTALQSELASVAERVEVAPTQIRKLRTVQHLETPLSAIMLKNPIAWEWAMKLHPTPAVAGWPRDAALAWLRRHESGDRGHYAAPVGWMAANGDGVFAVGIRSALICNNRAWLFAGAGIVADSDPDQEWDETEWKLKEMADALRLSNHVEVHR